MVERLPSLRGIEAFACVSEVLNLRIASERLNVTVSAVSHRIQGLEAELGLKLFERGKQGLRLTAEGAAFRDRLLPGLRALQDATRLTQTTLRKTVLKLSAPPVFHESWLLPRLGAFLESRPDTRIELVGPGRRRASGCDVVFAPLTAATIREGAFPIVEVCVTPMCSPAFLARHAIRAPEDLLRLPLIDFKPVAEGWPVWLESAGVVEATVEPAILIDDHILVFEAMAKGLGVSLGSRQLFQDAIERGLVVCPFDLEVKLPPMLGVSARNDERITRAFVDWVRAEAEASFGAVEMEARA